MCFAAFPDHDLPSPPPVSTMLAVHPADLEHAGHRADAETLRDGNLLRGHASRGFGPHHIICRVVAKGREDGYNAGNCGDLPNRTDSNNVTLAMAEPDRTMHIAEIPYENGQIRFRYERYPAPDGKTWIRHGLFRAYYQDGQLASEGLYEHGLETGIWHDFHENGRLAAEGEYKNGRRCGVWKFYDEAGRLESEEEPDGGS